MTLLTVEVETKNEQVYRIPSMPEETMKQLLGDLEKHGRGASSNLTLVTLDQVTLVIPWRIVKVLRVEGKERWRSLV